VLKASGAAAMTVFATPLRAAAPEPTAITPALVDAAKKEGKVICYTSLDLPISEKIAKAFETKFPGITVRVERTGAERVFQRIGQEYASNIHAVDVVNSSDASHFIVWRATACWRRSCRRTWRSTTRRSRRTPTACSPASAAG
jgi:iron(III) transport system substrate-binding protein